jgi:hypothetical protein
MTCTGEPRQVKTIAIFTSLDREFSGTAAWALANCMSAVGLLQNDFPVFCVLLIGLELRRVTFPRDQYGISTVEHDLFSPDSGQAIARCRRA